MAAQASLLCHLREADMHGRCQMGNIKRTWDLRGPGETIGAILLRLANCRSAWLQNMHVCVCVCVCPLTDPSTLQLITLYAAI